MIADSTGELPVALPHVSDEEDDGKLFGGSTIREQKVINFNINVIFVSFLNWEMDTEEAKWADIKL